MTGHPDADGRSATVYRWHWRKRLPERYGQTFVVLTRGTLNSCLIQFEDEFRSITTRNALRRVEKRPILRFNACIMTIRRV